MMKVGVKDCKSQGTKISGKSQFPREEEEDEDHGENKKKKNPSGGQRRVDPIGEDVRTQWKESG